MAAGQTSLKPAAGAKAPEDVRYVGAVKGCYVFASRGNTAEGQPQVFPCRTISISTREAVLVAPVVGTAGERLIAHFDQVGLLRGQVVRLIADGFAMTFTATDMERATLAARIAWLKKRSTHAAVEQRELERRLPHHPRSVILLPDNETLGCIIIDLSGAGVAVSADIVPEIGAPIAVGTVVGYVARHFESGFAVKFADIQDDNGLEERLGIQPTARNAVLAKLRSLSTTGAGQK